MQLVITGPDLDGLDRFSGAIVDRLEKVPGYVGVTRDLDEGKPEFRVRIDRDRAVGVGPRPSAKPAGTRPSSSRSRCS